MIDATPNIFVVLNDKRQVIYANKALQDYVRAAELDQPIYGKRPGEILDCVHAGENMAAAAQPSSARRAARFMRFCPV